MTATPQGISKAPLPFPRRPILRSSFPWSSSALTDEQFGEKSLLNTYMASVPGTSKPFWPMAPFPWHRQSGNKDAKSSVWHAQTNLEWPQFVLNWSHWRVLPVSSSQIGLKRALDPKLFFFCKLFLCKEKLHTERSLYLNCITKLYSGRFLLFKLYN